MDYDILDTNEHIEDEESSLRPASFDEYVGQHDLKENLRVFVGAAKMRDETLDHVLFYGPPGLGKTTMSMIIANEMGTHIKITTGPSIEKTGDLVALLTSLEPGDVLFIDEIHRLNKVVEEILYPAMEDFCVDVMIGKDATTRSVRIDLPPFTLVGATTRAGDISAPLRDRFGIVAKLDYYKDEELRDIISRTKYNFQFVKTKISPKFPLLLYTISQTSELSRTSGSLYTGNTDVSCFSIPQKSLIYSAFLFHRNPLVSPVVEKPEAM